MRVIAFFWRIPQSRLTKPRRGSANTESLPALPGTEKQLGAQAACAAGTTAAIASSEQRTAGVPYTEKLVTLVEAKLSLLRNMLTRQDDYLSTTEPAAMPSKITSPPSPLPVQPAQARHPHNRPLCRPVPAQRPGLRYHRKLCRNIDQLPFLKTT